MNPASVIFLHFA